MHQVLLTVSVLLCLGGTLSIGVVSADQPSLPQPETNELDANETATLWSKSPNECPSGEEYHEQFGEQRTALEGLSDCTDISFAEPPETANIWTQSDFESLSPGSASTAVYPEHATTADGQWISDAHATVFAIQPATVVHQDSDETPVYIAPQGDIYGFIDYRVDVPEGESTDARTVSWSLVEHEISDIRVKQDETLIHNTSDQHTPQLEYELTGSGSTTLTLEADIDVKLERAVTYHDSSGTNTITETRSENLTVSDQHEVETYNLTAAIYHAAYPDGDNGVAIYQSQPWHGYQLTEDGDTVVRGVWRYYTARDTNWDTLIRASATETEQRNSTAVPVYVRAFPSETGPRADPIREGPAIEEVWGSESPSPNQTLHDNVEVDVIDEPYVRSYGVAVRYDDIDRDHLEVQGIVRGETAELVEPAGGTERQIRKSNLSVEIVEQNESAATIAIELRDAETGTPIELQNRVEDHPRYAPIGTQVRDGYISVGDTHVETNSSGIATVTLAQPGAYSVAYHPGTWRTHDPAYVGDGERLSWHPLATANGWFSLLVHVFWLSLPFGMALYAGLKLGSFLHIPEGYNP
ncbi:hypothetical protein [Natrarchaeobius chitinivorans]|uniref:Uncharacterized protein n=1 Tax=Natrarchaeobius chitinivorans TaxID=1679083 RepID=A0A3N6MIP0_NATCH|nr:hypothetical protein [Natrarchaeobius chitinivorans]RQG95561.1 hypothetical protein EA473_08810 [Natrarchaeobius chitinivorans]